MNIVALESGYDFITFYFKDSRDLNDAAIRLYKYMKRVDFKHLDLQRKNFAHLPGDVPHFHNGIDATKGPHFHILYPHRPTKSDWDELTNLTQAKLVNITGLPGENKEIS